MKITLPGGEMINNVSWVITGPNNASTVVQQGTLNVQGSLTINFLVGGLSAGTGYNIALAGTSSDGSVTCTGSAQFSVTARTTSAVTDLLQCNAVSSEAGSVQVTAPTYNCATAGSISALPAETSVGSSVPLTGTATAADPSAITYAWSAPSGTFSAPTAANTNFTCTVQGPVTVTLTVGDGPLPDGGTCSPALATTTVQLICD